MLIATTRFNNKTYIENSIWRKNKNYDGCIYGLPHRISDIIPIYKKMIIIEMNNESNAVMGIGRIINYLRVDKRPKIHSDPKYNKYIYKGKYRVDREDLDEDILNILENILFTSSKHYKRLRGITRISTYRFGETLDKDFKIGDKVKKIFGTNFGKEGTVIEKKGNKIKVLYEENGLKKVWSLRNNDNYVKLDKKEKKMRNKGKNKCRLCGEIKKNHHCVALKNDKNQRRRVNNYLINLFNK